MTRTEFLEKLMSNTTESFWILSNGYSDGLIDNENAKEINECLGKLWQELKKALLKETLTIITEGPRDD